MPWAMLRGGVLCRRCWQAWGVAGGWVCYPADSMLTQGSLPWICSILNNFIVFLMHNIAWILSESLPSPYPSPLPEEKDSVSLCIRGGEREKRFGCLGFIGNEII